MGSKTAARDRRDAGWRARRPGTDGRSTARRATDEIARRGGAVGYPLMVKAVAGGGGKGMRVVESREPCLAVQTARSEAGSAFGDTRSISSGG
jgi:acetyl/propionyl-CoA carboxylase alpha subunit